MPPLTRRFTGASLRPTLRFGGNTGRVNPAAPRLSNSSHSIVSVSPCLPQMSCRFRYSQARGLATSRPVMDQGKPRRPPLARSVSSEEEVGKLVNARQAADPENILLEFDKLHEPVTMTNVWLRDACECHLCVNESSGQKNFATCDIPSDLKIDGLRTLEDGSLEVSWANDLAPGSHRHVSTYPLDLLHKVVRYSPVFHRHIPAREIWDSQHFEQDSRSREISYASWMEDSSSFAEALRNLHLWGLVIVKGVPQTELAVEQVASRLGHLQSTFYGPTWDVISKPRAENVAYTNEFLCLHQDLMYMQSPPRIQILHCLENSCEGGESLFSDGIRAAYELQLKHPDHYHVLSKVPTNFHYRKGGHYYENNWRTITHSPGSKFWATRCPEKVYWSPPFQAPFWSRLTESPKDPQRWGDRTDGHAKKWHDAAKVFQNSIEDSANMAQFRLQPGDCVVFDNLRVLHGRRGFNTASGRRHLRGTYIEDQTFDSTWMRLQQEGLMFSSGAKELEEERRARRVLGIKDDEGTGK